jgi:hypothetical protein
MQVIEYFENQAPIAKRLSWSGINPSSFYYVSKTGNPGLKPGDTTLKTDGCSATNLKLWKRYKAYWASSFYVLVMNQLQKSCLTMDLL